jgi:hypothetical protein
MKKNSKMDAYDVRILTGFSWKEIETRAGN